ncbi:MAG: TonB-dependent receptor [Cyanobacteria bacterium P01_G01_bin.54]
MVKQNSLDGWRVMATTTALALAIAQPMLAQEFGAHRLQQAQASLIKITEVQVRPTETDLDLSLGTATQVFELPPTTVLDNALIVEIPNAVLNLPNEDAFEVADPIAGIIQITVANLSDNRVRVMIVGLDAPPMATVGMDSQGLVVAIAPDLGPIAETPDTATTDAPALRIIVTAEKKPEALQEVPLSVTALTEQEIEDADITDLDAIARNTPNFSFFPSGNRFVSFYSIRGISNASSLVNRDPIDVYIDGVPTGLAAFTNLDLPDLERVEVLRGPQSVLYGRNAIAGVVNIITRKPSNVFEFSGIAQYGNFNDFNVRASASGPLAEDQLFFRLSSSYSGRDGYMDNILLNDDVDEQYAWTGRAQLLWTPSAEWEILVNTAFDNYQEGAAPYALIGQSDPFETQQNFNGFNQLISDAQSLKIAYNHPELRFTATTTRRASRTAFKLDGDASTIDAVIRTSDESSTNLVSQELLFQSPESAETFQWTVGGYFEANQLNQVNNGLAIGDDGAAVGFAFPSGSLNLSNIETNTTTVALFGQASYQATDALTLTAGLRYESTQSRLERYESSLSIPGFPTTTLLSLENIETNSSELLPLFIAQYRFNPDLMVYGSLTRGYRPAGINLTPQTAETVTYEAERSWNYELGLKSTLLDNRLGINLALFHNPVNDFQVLTFDSNQLGSVIENADVSITGAELELRATPVDGLNITAGLGYVDAEFTDYPNNASLNGNKLTYAPDLTYNLAVQYRDPSGILGRVELQGAGVTYFEEDNVLKQDPYAIVNARLGYEAENHGIYLFANNIFNTEYLNQAFTFSPLGQLGIYGAPSTFGVQFKAKF